MKQFLKKLKTGLNSLMPATDKLMHFFLGSIIFAAVWCVCWLFDASEVVQISITYGILFALSIAKEIVIDPATGGHSSKSDIYYSVAPAFLFTLVHQLSC